MPFTLCDIYQSLKSQFNPHDAWMIIEHVAGYGREVLIAVPETPVSEEQKAQIEDIVERYQKGEPLTRILGLREFWGLEFEVTPDVLDPRPDTETLVEAALKWAKQHPNPSSHPSEGWDLVAQNQKDPKSSLGCGGDSLGYEDGGEVDFRILDLGTGTGCIPLALLSELPNAKAVAVDKSAKALGVARKNAEKHKMSNRITFIQSDWFDALEEQKFDLIVSNPPYIADSVIQNLDVSVKNHDPFMALSGGESGLECYKIILSNLNNYLKGGGRAFLEIGYDQLESVIRLVDDSNLSFIRGYKDFAGNDRVVEISNELNGDK